MTTILILNGISALGAAVGIGGWTVRRRRERKAQAVVVTADGRRATVDADRVA